MKAEIKAWLADIKQAITEIHLFLPDKTDFNTFQRDLKTKRAIERNIEIIGEAVNRIVKVEPDFPKIIDTRNRIIHGYDTVSEDIIWAIVIKELDKLEKEVDELLNQ
jgi:uncharacterized protein with HEPN domain